MKNKIILFALLALLLVLIVTVKNVTIFLKIVEAAVVLFAAVFYMYPSEEEEAPADELPREENILTAMATNIKEVFKRFIDDNDIDRILFITITNGQFNVDYDFGFAENDEMVFERKVVFKAYKDEKTIEFANIEGYKNVRCDVLRNKNGEIYAALFLGNIRAPFAFLPEKIDRFLKKAGELADVIAQRYKMNRELERKMLKKYIEKRETPFFTFSPHNFGERLYAMDTIKISDNSYMLFTTFLDEQEDFTNVIEELGYLKHTLNSGAALVKTREALRKNGASIIEKSFVAEYIATTKFISFQLSTGLYMYRKTKNMMKYRLTNSSASAADEQFEVLEQLQLLTGDSILITDKELEEKALANPQVESAHGFFEFIVK